MRKEADSTDLLSVLTRRQIEIFNYLLRGFPMKKVARQLGITPRTVAVNKYHVMGVLGLKNNEDIFSYFSQFGFPKTEEDLRSYLKQRVIEQPPQVPAQGTGPHLEINAEGLITFAPPEALDNEGNYLPRLQALHPDLRDLARELATDLAKGNAPHAVLGTRASAYLTLIDQDLDKVDFYRLYAAGVRLANAVYAIERDTDLPPLKPGEREKVESLLALHGSFILATKAGADAMADEERYQRRPAEERRYRTDAQAIAAHIQNRPDLVASDVANEMAAAASEVGQGRNPERSSVLGRATTRNVMISLVSGAIGGAIMTNPGLLMVGASYLGLLALSETIKKAHWFQSLTSSTASAVDAAMDGPTERALERLRDGLARQAEFVEAHEAAVRQLAGTRQELEFLHRAMDWLRSHPSAAPGAELPDAR